MLTKEESQEIIDALGGSTEFARLAGVTDTAAWTWRHRGFSCRAQLVHAALIRRGQRLAAKNKT